MTTAFPLRPFGEMVDWFDSRRVPVKSADRKPGPYPYYGASGIVDWVDGYLFEGLHLLVSEDGENLRSRSTPIAFLADGKYWVNNHAHVVRGRDDADTRFFGYAMSVTDIAGHVSGSAQPKLSQSSLQAVLLPTPPAAERRAIAEVLGALDDKIAANERIVALASELGAATFRASAASNTEVLSDVATIVMGTSPTGETMNEDGRGVPFQQGVRDFGVRFPSDRVWTTAPIRYASPGDVLLSVRAPVGRTNVADKDMCIGRGLAAIRSRRGTPWTLFHALSSVPDVWEPFEAGGTVFGSINKSQLASLEVPAVEGLVSALEARLAPLEERIAVAERESQKLADLRDALLPELMSGRLRVKDAEKTVEEVV